MAEGDTPADTATTSQWITKRELAQARGITLDSAERLIRRHGWRRQPGNDGRVRVLVPPDWLRPAEAEQPASDRSDPRETSSDMAAFETALAHIEAAHSSEINALREQIAAANQAKAEATTLLQQLAGLVRDTDEAAKLERARAADEITGLRADVDAASARAREAEERAEELRREIEARKVRGLMARLRAALRGE